MAVATVALASAAYGQRISIGAIGGTNLTANFPVTDVSMPADDFGNPANRFQYLTGRRSLILGALIEARLTERFSIEANVLHRPMKNRIIYTEFHPDGSTTVSNNSFNAVRAWEFPVLLRYTLPPTRFTGRFRPFLAAGPSFRTQEDASATEPSQLGISAGVGAAFQMGRFRIAPTLRYTRWARESIYPRYATKPDQVEFLTSFSYETNSANRRLAGRKLEIGVIAGLSPTRALPEIGLGDSRTERTRYLAGLSAQMVLKDNFAVEVNAIYKPLRAGSRFADSRTRFSVLTWQFPVLAKYRWIRPNWTPFVVAGPSFRVAGNLNAYNPSRYGVTVGGGVETRTGKVRLAPGLRYTRWARDSGRYSVLATNPNAVEVVFGVSF